jgi:hypothetical protein
MQPYINVVMNRTALGETPNDRVPILSEGILRKDAVASRVFLYVFKKAMQSGH